MKYIFIIFSTIFLLSFSHVVTSQTVDAKSPTVSQPVNKTTPVKKIKWMSFEQAYQLNKKKPKKIFIDVYTDWCGWCKRMDATTFIDPVIVEYMNKNFYCVKMDAERKDTVVIDGVTFINPNPQSRRSTHQLAVELLQGKLSYPSYVFLNEKSQMLTVIPGYQQAKDFEPMLHYFSENAYQNTSWEEFRTKFQGEVK